MLFCTDTAPSTKWSTLSLAVSHHTRRLRGRGRWSEEPWRASSASQWPCVAVWAIAAAVTACSAGRPAGTRRRRRAAADTGRWRRLAANVAVIQTASSASSSSEPHAASASRRIISLANLTHRWRHSIIQCVSVCVEFPSVINGVTSEHKFPIAKTLNVILSVYLSLYSSLNSARYLLHTQNNRKCRKRRSHWPHTKIAHKYHGWHQHYTIN